jgi:hypothetical protein
MTIEVALASGSVEAFTADAPIRVDVDEGRALIISYSHGEVIAVFAPGVWSSAKKQPDRVRTLDE